MQLFTEIDPKVSDAPWHTVPKKDAPKSDRVNYHRPQQNLN